MLFVTKKRIHMHFLFRKGDTLSTSPVFLLGLDDLHA